jgi:ferritin-like metal-binding protein YciE
MTASSLEDQLIKYLTDAHSIEEQALAQLRSAPDLAGDPEISAAFSRHLAETEGHESLVRSRLEARNGKPSTAKDLAGTVTGKGFVLFARSQPDTPGKLVAHAFSYEHMELAAYDLLGRMAERANDQETADAAGHILGQERAMAERLEGLFDRAVEASLRELEPDDLGDQLGKYLADAHAIEAQAIQLLEKGPQLAGAEEIAHAYTEHLAETEEHQRLVGERLRACGSGPSKVKDAAMRLGALNWGMFFRAQPDTPAKLAAFAYAFEHLEIAGYELLKRVTRKVGDDGTEEIATRILAEERAAAERIRALFDVALESSLHEQGVGAR